MPKYSIQGNTRFSREDPANPDDLHSLFTLPVRAKKSNLWSNLSTNIRKIDSHNQIPGVVSAGGYAHTEVVAVTAGGDVHVHSAVYGSSAVVVVGLPLIV